MAPETNFNFTLGGQVEFRSFLREALHDCRRTKWGSRSSDCPRKTYLSSLTHACCDENDAFMHLSINSVKLNQEQSVEILDLLNSRIADGFEFTSDINVHNEMILVANFHHTASINLLRVFKEEGYLKIELIISSYKTSCLLDNTEKTLSESCPRVINQHGVKFCCDFDEIR